MSTVTSVRQVALAARNLDLTLAWWRDVLDVPTHAVFDPPGIAFLTIGDVRLFFSETSPPGTVYLDCPDLDAVHARLSARGVVFMSGPVKVHVDADGTFGPAGESEWMAFLKDPSGNTVGLVTRKA
jgi:catechol 2,3-dioxygenase-like lactoylglutathione lyase family enzyme